MFNFIKKFFTSNNIKNFNDLERIKNSLNLEPLKSDPIPIRSNNPTNKSSINSPKEKLHPLASKNCIPSKNGLYPHEILLLHYAPTFTTSCDSFQKFWKYQYDIKSVADCLNSLLKKGFITIGSIEKTLANESIASLKNHLKVFSLKVSGNKNELVERLISNVDFNSLESYFPNKYYELTPLGESELNENSYIVYIHKKNLADLDIWKVNIIANSNPKNSNPYDNIWEYLNKYSLKCYRKKEFGLFRNSRLDMAIFLSDEKKYNHALAMISEVIFYDLNGLDYDFKMLKEYDSIKSFTPFETCFLRIPPGIVKFTNSYIENLSLSNNEIKSLMLERMNSLHVPTLIFTPEECIDIFFKELENDFDNLKIIFSNAFRRFKSK